MIYTPQNIPSIIGIASNVRGGQNPPFDISDFYSMYPQFFKSDDDVDSPDIPDEPDDSDDSDAIVGLSETIQETPEPLIPLVMLEAYVELAHACVKMSRFRNAWKVCMGLFIAHFVTLYLLTMADPLADAATVGKAGMTNGVQSSKAVDGVSVSYDYSLILNDLDGWADWKSTAYGVQLATWARMFSMAGMYVH